MATRRSTCFLISPRMWSGLLALACCFGLAPLVPRAQDAEPPETPPAGTETPATPAPTDGATAEEPATPETPDPATPATPTAEEAAPAAEETGGIGPAPTPAPQTPPQTPPRAPPAPRPGTGRTIPAPAPADGPQNQNQPPGPAGNQTQPAPGTQPDGRAPPAGAGQQTPPNGDRQLTTILPKSDQFKHERVDIATGEIDAMEFLRFLADYTGLPVILDSSNPAVLTQKIMIAAPMKDVTADVVIAILQANRFLVTRQVLPSGTEVLNVVSQTQGQVQQGEPTETPVIFVEGGAVKSAEQSITIEGLTLRPDEIATMVFTLKYTQPTDAIQSLNSLVGGSKPGGPRSQAFSIVDVKNSMLVIVTAKFGLLNYIAKLLAIIDVPIKETERIIQIIEVENADADELTALIQQFLQGRTAGGRFGGRAGLPAPVAGQPGQPVAAAATRGTQNELQTNLIPDWRTQKIIVETYSERDLEDIHMLIRELDTRFDIRRLKTRIYQVNYLKAEEVASDLQLLLGGTSGGFSGRAGLGTRGAAAGGAAGGAGARSRRSSGVQRVSGRTPGAGVGGPTPNVPGGAAGGNQSAPLPALIVPHIQTNSLIIQAEPEEYAEILSILDQIDIKRRQVFLEAALVQVTTTSSLLYTIELLAGEPNDTATRALFESSFGLSGIDLAEFDRTLPDLSAPGSVPAGALLAIMHRGKFPALVRFFKSNTESEVLATPFILADDNQQNVIEILETRYVQNTATGSSQVTTTSQQGEDAGITLEITPTISSQNALYLEMSLSVSQFEPGGGSATLLPPRTENTITSAVTIPDGEIFVIGGLTRENRSKSVSKVPIVGDIPLVGKLFRSEVTNKSAANLYIFLRAHVLTHPAFEDGKDITRQGLNGVYAFAPNLEPTRFTKPQVSAPPAKARDPDAPTRYYPSRARSRAQEGHEKPLGPYTLPTTTPTGAEESYRQDPEDPGHQTPPKPGPEGGARRPEPATVPAPTNPPATPPDRTADPGGLEMPPITDTPPAGVEPGSEPALDGTGMERDPEGDSWFVPLRPKKSATP